MIKTIVYQQTSVIILIAAILAQWHLSCNEMSSSKLFSNVLMWCVMAYVAKGTYMMKEMKAHFSPIWSEMEPESSVKSQSFSTLQKYLQL